MLKFAYEFDLIFIILFVAIIPVFVFYYRAKRDIIKKFFSEVSFVELIENKDYTKEIIRFLLFFFAGVMLIIALARPQVGTKVETVKQTDRKSVV